MSSTKPNSRFSTFKGLFGPKGPVGPAPAPPPKDAWYSQPSAASSSASFRPSRSDAASPTTEELSPAGSAYPGSPRITDPRAPSPAPSRSTTSSHAASQSPGLTPDSAQRKGFRLPGFPRRPSRTPLSPESPPARPDEGISTPWNFQHHLHVDESMNNLPPSWVSSLSEAGYSEEDIAALRAGAGRAVSPQPAVLARPNPRTSSLLRMPSSASIASRFTRGGPARIPPDALSPSPAYTRKLSDASSTFSAGTSGAQYVYAVGRGDAASSSSSLASRQPPPTADSLASSYRSPAGESFVDLDSSSVRSGHSPRPSITVDTGATPQKSRPGPSKEVTRSPPPVYRLNPTEQNNRNDDEADEEEDEFDPDYRRDTMVPDSRRDTVVPGSKRDTVVPASKRDTVVPASNRDTLVPSSNRDTVVPRDRERDIAGTTGTGLMPPSASPGLARSPSLSSIGGSGSPSSSRAPSPAPASIRSPTAPSLASPRARSPPRTPSPPPRLPPLQSVTTPISGQNKSPVESAAPALPDVGRKRRSKRFSVLPPRLSLDQGTIGDLSSWSSSLFSTLSATDENDDVLANQQASVPTVGRDLNSSSPAASIASSAGPSGARMGAPSRGPGAGLPSTPRLPASPFVNPAGRSAPVPASINERTTTEEQSAGPSRPVVAGLPSNPRQPPVAGGLPLRPTPKSTQLRVQTSSAAVVQPPLVQVRAPPSRSDSYSSDKAGASGREQAAQLPAEALSPVDPPPAKPLLPAVDVGPLQPVLPKPKRKPTPLTDMPERASPRMGAVPTSPSSVISSGSSGNPHADPPSVSTPLWNELLGLASPVDGSDSSSPDGPASAFISSPFTPAIDANSPILPTRPSLAATGRGRSSLVPPPVSVPQPNASRQADRLSLLSPDLVDSRRNSDATVRSDRDSSMTTVSAEIVRGEIVAYKQAMPTVVAKTVPSPSRSPEEENEDRIGGPSIASQDKLAPPPSPSRSSSTVSTPRTAGTERPVSPTSSYGSQPSSSRSASPSAGWSSSSSRRPAFTIVTSVSSVESEASPKTPALAYLEASPISPSPKVSPALQSPAPSPQPFPSAWRAQFGEETLRPVPTYDAEFASQTVPTVQDFLNLSQEDDTDSEPASAPASADSGRMRRPRIVVSGLEVPGSAEALSSTTSPLSSAQTPAVYRGWVSEVVAPLSAFIDDTIDPRARYVDLQEIGEGESGSVFCAHVVEVPTTSTKARNRRTADTSPSANMLLVAIKSIPMSPGGSPKIEDLRRELELMQGARNAHILTMDMLYVDFVEDSLWIRMELMETSLADVISVADEGVELTEPLLARFAEDALTALDYLQSKRIAHRDVRSDNMLVNRGGVLKLADFSTATRVEPTDGSCTDVAGVIYWQAPEVRAGSYDPLKVDVFSLGATVWEMAQHEPPFAAVQDITQITAQWPPLDNPDDFTSAFHDFLRLCSMVAPSRPSPEDLLHTPFIRSAAPRRDVIQILDNCRLIEEGLQRRGSEATIS